MPTKFIPTRTPCIILSELPCRMAALHTHTLSSKHHYAVGRYDGRWNNDGCESRLNGDEGHRRGKFILWNGPRPEIKAKIEIKYISN